MPMTFERFSQANRNRCESWFGFNHKLADWSTSDWFVAIMGELGEAANVAKNLNRVRDGIPGNKESPEQLQAKLRKELGDVFVYLDLLCQAHGFNVADADVEVFNAKSAEIGYGTKIGRHSSNDEVERLRAALKPFAGAVFNDNGDMTISPRQRKRTIHQSVFCAAAIINRSNVTWGKRVNVLDLFCGAVGGWSLGLHRAGFRTVAACEIDPWRRSLYGHNNPGAKLYGDIRELTADQLVSDLGFLPDIIAGSPPCQDASAANTKGQGIDGPETGLFLEALRLVREVRPAWALFENSPRLRTRGVDRVLDELDAAGYARWPLVVGADDIGAPHERKRMWLVAHAKGERRRPGSPGANQRQEPGDRRADEAGHSDSTGLEIGESLTGDALAQFEALERAVGPAVHTWNGGAARHLLLAHGAAPELARIRVPDHKHPGRTINAAKACISAQGDAILPQISEAIGRAIMKARANSITTRNWHVDR